MKTLNLLTLSLMLAFASSGLALAEEKTKETDKLPLDDQFIIKSLVANNAVLRLAELVEPRSENVKVEAFAKDVIAEHKKVSEKLGKLVTDRKIAVVAGLEKELRDEVEALSKLKGEDFDKAYLDSFIRGHEKCLAMCKGQATDGKDVALIAMAKECHPTLEGHLKKAKELRASLAK